MRNPRRCVTLTRSSNSGLRMMQRPQDDFSTRLKPTLLTIRMAMAGSKQPSLCYIVLLFAFGLDCKFRMIAPTPHETFERNPFPTYHRFVRSLSLLLSSWRSLHCSTTPSPPSHECPLCHLSPIACCPTFHIPLVHSPRCHRFSYSPPVPHAYFVGFP